MIIVAETKITFFLPSEKELTIKYRDCGATKTTAVPFVLSRRRYRTVTFKEYVFIRKLEDYMTNVHTPDSVDAKIAQLLELLDSKDREIERLKEHIAAQDERALMIGQMVSF